MRVNHTCTTHFSFFISLKHIQIFQVAMSFKHANMCMKGPRYFMTKRFALTLTSTLLFANYVSVAFVDPLGIFCVKRAAFLTPALPNH